MSVMPPPGFKYMKAYLAGRPTHTPFDGFYHRHPPMDRRKRSKIFAPFDALYGFDERIKAKTVLYEEKRRLSEGEMDELNQKLCRLHSLTANGRHVEKAMTGTTDLFSKIEFDPWREQFEAALDAAGIAWRLDSVDFEVDTGFWHWSWRWGVRYG